MMVIMRMGRPFRLGRTFRHFRTETSEQALRLLMNSIVIAVHFFMVIGMGNAGALL